MIFSMVMALKMETFYQKGIKYFTFLSGDMSCTIDKRQFTTDGGAFDAPKFQKQANDINAAYVDKWFRDRIKDGELKWEKELAEEIDAALTSYREG